ncbi:MAG: hypothetical protein NT091_03165, partial [Candidatus Falkowbacteria bacterium]|nr:hypothetical protein [Candidatus Falkowbacteria bacterium]
MSRKNLLALSLILIFTIVGALGFVFWGDLSLYLGLSSSNQSKIQQNLSGSPITISTSVGQVTIPPVLSTDVLDELERELTENAGMPLKVDKKG